MSEEFDTASARDVVDALLAAEERVLPAVRDAAPDIAKAADLIADRWRAGGRIVFAGAGTSGRIAWSQAAELPGTFGLPRERILARIAGGIDSTDGDEDDLAAAERDLADLQLTKQDVLVAVAASGSTPYTLALVEAAIRAGTTVIAVATVRESALADHATVIVEAVVGPEALRDSTRLGAGTAQKLVLDALTTAAAARLGRVHADRMLDVVPANAKLQERAAGIVADVAACELSAAREALQACQGNARAAVLVLVRGLEPAAAAALAARHETLRNALVSGS